MICKKCWGALDRHWDCPKCNATTTYEDLHTQVMVTLRAGGRAFTAALPRIVLQPDGTISAGDYVGAKWERWRHE